jgi:fluoride ion exporter CrcB/FEX
MLGLHVLAPLLKDILQRHPDAPLSRWLLREVGVRRGTANKPPNRVDRLLRAAAAAVIAAIALGLGVVALTASDKYPALSPRSHLLTGIGFFGVFSAFTAVVVAVSELVKALFAPSPGSRLDRRP